MDAIGMWSWERLRREVGGPSTHSAVGPGHTGTQGGRGDNRGLQKLSDHQPLSLSPACTTRTVASPASREVTT